MQITEPMLRAMSRGKPNADNMKSVLDALNEYGPAVGLDKSHRQAHYLAQLLHESGSFKYDREIASGAAYEGRKDLGNTQKGDGRKYKGRGPIQITGRANYREFTKWARGTIDPDAPNFETNPEAVNTGVWEGLGPIWYWTTRNLNRLADDNNLLAITQRINGGRNGLDDRISYYVRAALVILGYKPDQITRFQQDKGLRADGVVGDQTLMALHTALKGSNPFAIQKFVEVPVEVEKKVVPERVDKAVTKTSRNWFGWAGGAGTLTGLYGYLDDVNVQIIAIGAGLVLAGGLIYLVFGPIIIRRIKAIRAELEAE